MSIYIKLLESKREIGKATKNATNPHFKNKYVDINALIETVEPILLSKGLILLQPIENGKQYTRIIDAESGDLVESYIDLPLSGTPQAYGSAQTYYRRYTLQGLLSMQAQDDDGQVASQPIVKKMCSDDEFSAIVDKYLQGNKQAFKQASLTLDFTTEQKLEAKEIVQSQN